MDIPDFVSEGSAHDAEVECGGCPHPPSVWLVAVAGEAGSRAEKSARGDPWVCWLGFVQLGANLELARLHQSL